MLDQLAYMLGGRAAEELVFHDPTTGASNDIEKATSLARRMVTQYGMTERLGAIKFGSERGEPFLGREIGHERDYSEQVAAAVDDEVQPSSTRRPRRRSTSPRRTAMSWTPSSSQSNGISPFSSGVSRARHGRVRRRGCRPTSRPC